MTIQGIIIINILGLCFIALIVNLTRTQKLYIGYAAIWLLATVGLLIAISIPSLLGLITRTVGALFPVSALTLLAFVFVFVLLIFFSVKLTALSERQAQLIQALALKDTLATQEKYNTGHGADMIVTHRPKTVETSNEQ